MTAVGDLASGRPVDRGNDGRGAEPRRLADWSPEELEVFAALLRRYNAGEA